MLFANRRDPANHLFTKICERMSFFINVFRIEVGKAMIIRPQ